MLEDAYKLASQVTVMDVADREAAADCGYAPGGTIGLGTLTWRPNLDRKRLHQNLHQILTFPVRSGPLLTGTRSYFPNNRMRLELAIL